MMWILNDNLTDNSLIACSNKALKKFNTNVNLTFQKRVKSKCYNPKSEKVEKANKKKKVVISKFTLTCISLQTI